MSSLSLSEWLRPRPGHLLDATLSDATGEGGPGGSRARNQRCSQEVTHPFCSQHSSQNGANDPTGAETVGYLLQQHNWAYPDGWRTQKVRNSVLQSREWGRVKIRQQQSIQVTGAWVTGSQMFKECVQTRVPQRPCVSCTLSSWLALPSTTIQAGPSSINLLPSPWDPCRPSLLSPLKICVLENHWTGSSELRFNEVVQGWNADASLLHLPALAS